MNDLISVPDAICILRIALAKQPFNQLIRDALVLLGATDLPPNPHAIVRRRTLCGERDCNGDQCYLAPGHSGDHAVLDPRGTFKTPCSWPTCNAAGVCPPIDFASEATMPTEPDPACDGCGTYAWVFGDDRPAVGDDCPDGDCCGTIQPADTDTDGE